ncbi:MAG: hypothetical protein ACFCVF_04370 [Kineosporiaceae bacterium]
MTGAPAGAAGVWPSAVPLGVSFPVARAGLEELAAVAAVDGDLAAAEAGHDLASAVDGLPRGGGVDVGRVLESMQTWSDAIGPEIRTAVATSLRENRETRDHVVSQARQDPDDRALVTRIATDGQVTLAEYRLRSDVQDAVDDQGGWMVAQPEAQAASDQASPT